MRSKIPTEHDDTVSVAPTAGVPILAESFRKDRRHGFEQRQDTTDTKVILVQRGAVTLQKLVHQVDSDNIASIDDTGNVTIRLPMATWSEALLARFAAAHSIAAVRALEASARGLAGIAFCGTSSHTLDIAAVSAA